MRSKIKELDSEVSKIEKGKADIATLNHAIYLANIVLEQLYIVRYKAYTENLEAGEIESVPFDLTINESSTEPTNSPDPSIEMRPEDLFSNDVEQEKAEDSAPKEMQTDESVIITTIESEENNSEVDKATETNEELILQESSPETVLDPSPILDIISQCRGKHEKIDSFNGHYSLREKIDYINELFGGSSDSFTNAVRLIDHYSSVASMQPHLLEYYYSYKWEKAKKEVLHGFIEKLVACYEDH